MDLERFDEGDELVLRQEELAAMHIAKAAQAQLPAKFARCHFDWQPEEKMLRLVVLWQHGVLLGRNLGATKLLLAGGRDTSSAWGLSM